jgi:manganese transport protein
MNQTVNADDTTAPEQGWRSQRTLPSLPEVYRSVKIPNVGRNWWGILRKLLAFSGPGYLIAVGYMDPGNWATDLAGGSQFYYTLLSVVIVSSLMAIFLQHLALKLGVATGRDLAQACRDHFHPVVNFILWVGCEIAIAACDLAEVIGSAIALNLLFGLPLIWGVCLTACDVIAVLYLQNKGFRLIEALVLTLIGITRSVSAFKSSYRNPISGPWLGVAYRHPRSCTTATCFMWRSGSSEPQSCLTICICTRLSHRRAILN